MLISSQKNINFDEIKSFLPVSVASDIESLLPFIESAESEHIEPILGAALYANLLTYYANPSVTGTWIGTNHAKWAELLKKVQRALINLAYWSGYDLLNVTIDSTGFHREESETRKGLYKYQEDSLKSLFRNNGFNGLDKVLAYLEINIPSFADFKASSCYTVRKSSLVPDTNTLNSIFFIDNNRLVFLRIQRYIEQVEDFTIQSVLGASLYLKVKEEMVKDEPATEVSALLPYLKKPVVYLAVAKALGELGVNITDRSIFLESQETSSGDGIVRKTVPDNVLLPVIRAAEMSGTKYLELLKSFLVANATDYPEYSGQSGSVFTRDNSDKRTFWVG
jgi:hypothetical protein